MTTDFDWRLKMKNLGITGGLALVAAGLLANAFVTLDDDVQAGAVPANNYSGDVVATPECLELEPQVWFEQNGLEICSNQELDLPIANTFSSENGFDLDGDSIADHVNHGDFSWNSTWQDFDDPYGYSDLHSFSIGFVKGNRSFMKIPLVFDFEQLIPDKNYFWTVNSILFDVDGDKKLDLVVHFKSNDLGIDESHVTWHRNITPGNPLAADINLDGIVNGIDLAIVLASWNTPG